MYFFNKFQFTNYQWKAGYGFHLFRPEGGGAMGGSSIGFKKT